MNMMSENGAIVYVCGSGVCNWNLPLDMAFVVQLLCRGIVVRHVETCREALVATLRYEKPSNGCIISILHLNDRREGREEERFLILKVAVVKVKTRGMCHVVYMVLAAHWLMGDYSHP